MKLQFDFDNKTIKVCDTVNLEKFMDKLREILPNGLWKAFSLNQVENVYFGSYPYYHWYNSPTIGAVTLTSGTTMSGTTDLKTISYLTPDTISQVNGVVNL